MSRAIYKGQNFTLDEVPVELNGKSTMFSRIKNKPVVIIIPIRKDGMLILEEQRRPIINKNLIELPAGHIEKGERPYRAAARELEEETGYISRKLERIYTSYPLPGTSTQQDYYFIAQDLIKGRMHRDAHEQISLMEISLAQAMEMVLKNIIKDAKTSLGILLLNERMNKFPKKFNKNNL